jgi:hypothetical protein
VGDAGSPAVRVAAAEALHVDLLAGHAAHHVRAGHEDPPGGGHDHDVGQRRTVGGGAGRGAEHDRDLRDLAGGAGHGGEHAPDGVHRLHAVGELGAAGVPQPDHRHPQPGGEFDRVDDALGLGRAERAAGLGRVGAVRDHRGAVDPPADRDHTARTAGQHRKRAEIAVQQQRQPRNGIPRIPRIRLRGIRIRRRSVD